ncbi:MAG TPA: alpha/beta hydrolase [Streptosporangiaceae bacterium]|jgi:pimeloyl-ACP methyl ester carboxylesterase
MAVVPSVTGIPAALGVAGLFGTRPGDTATGGTGPGGAGSAGSGSAAAGPGGAAGSGHTAAGPPASLLPGVGWTGCQHGIPNPFQCATVTVPLDYRHPSGRKIKLAVLRLPASEPGKRIGSLFVNFGGPGGPDITDLVNRADTVFGSAIRQRFDLVTWDPRGVEYSTPVNCFGSQAASNAYYNSLPVFPYPQPREPAFFQLSAQLGKDCQRRAGGLLPHISTADSARDLDMIRRDLGESKLSYLGFSYGTVLGATYANLFPGRVRAMVLDGTLDFTGNAAGHQAGDGAKLPVDVRQGVDKAGQDAFNRFLALCARAGSKCAFSGGSLHAKWATLLSRARSGQLSYQNLMTLAYYDMESPIADWPGLASSLQSLYRATSAGRALSPRRAGTLRRAAVHAASQGLLTPRTRAAQRAGAAAYTGNRMDAYYSTQCADSRAPTKTSVYHNLAISEDNKVPGFGRLIVYDMMPCAGWPAMHTGSYDGPWGRSRATILVINAVYDPITPMRGARTAVSELHHARLLTVNGDGHTSMFVEPSACRQGAETAYLTSLKLPPKGKVCQVNRLPWGLSP